MKAALEFLLPDEQDELDAAEQGMRLRLVVCELEETLRRWNKHGGYSGENTAAAAFETVRDLIHEMIQEEGLKPLW